MQALALFRGARGLSLARRCSIPQRRQLLCDRTVPVARAPRRNWCSSRLEWPPREASSSTSAVAAASRFASSSPSTSSSSPSTSSSSSPSSLPLPLCELPATEQANPRDLLAWRSWAKELVESLGPRGLSADGGPDRRELLVSFDDFFFFLSLLVSLAMPQALTFFSIFHSSLNCRRSSTGSSRTPWPLLPGPGCKEKNIKLLPLPRLPSSLSAPLFLTSLCAGKHE